MSGDEQVSGTTVADGHGRRDFLRKAGVGAAVAGAAWVAPQIRSEPAGAAPVTWYLQLLPDCSQVSPTTAPSTAGCEPVAWMTGETGPVNGSDLNWTLTENNATDCLAGFSLTFSDVGITIVDATAEEFCTDSSPPNSFRCVPGNISGSTVSFPDNSSPESCVYVGYWIIVNLGS